MGGHSGGHRSSPTSPVPAVDILEAVRQSMQTYEALYIGSLPVPRAMGKRRCSPVAGGSPESPPVPWGGRAALEEPCPAPCPQPGPMGWGVPSPQGWMC